MPSPIKTIPTKKTPPFHCRKCSFKTTGPHKMHLHYVKNPTHNPKKVPSPRQSRVPRKAMRRIQFCPYCAGPLGGLL